jgi:hypothetical protein
MHSKQKNHSEPKSVTWDRPFSSDVLISRTEITFSRTAFELAFVPPPYSILSIDDDQYRLTSALSEPMGFTRVNNAKEALGIASTKCRFADEWMAS